MLDIIFGWGRISLWTLLAQFDFAYFLTVGTRYGLQMKREADQSERQRHGFPLDDERKASEGAAKF